jgi:PAS domain S-box-containing protein
MLLTMPDGVIISANQSACRLFGMTEVEMLCAGRAGIVVSDEKLECAIRERNLKGKVKAEFTFRRKDGTIFVGEGTSSLFTDAEGITRTSMTIQDITERKRIEAALIESEARYRSLFEDNHAPMLLIDPSTGEIVDGNRVACEYYGYRHEQLVRLTVSDLNTLSPEQIREDMERSVRGERRHFDFRHRMANGDVCDVEVYSGPIPVHGRPLLYSIVHDVTERKRIEREFAKRTNELARSNSELQQFAYVASHDLQEPLRMVISYLTLLEKRYRDQLDPDAREFIHYAVDGGKRMKYLIDDLLAFSRVDIGGKEFVPVDMNTLVAKTIHLLKIPIEEGDAKVGADPLPTIEADESQMVQVMQNLVANAIKFHGASPPEVRISATVGAGEWIFAVQDNGIGLNLQYSDKIFQMFQRLHNRDQYPGTGVGLAIVKKIVERHGGRIWVESELGKGATFFFSIPRSSIS